MERNSFIFYRSFYEAISDLPDEEQLKIYKAISVFCLEFKEPELSGVSATIFKLIKPNLEANNKKFFNGKKAKRKQKVSKQEAKGKQTRSKTEANVDEDVDDNVDDNDKKEKSLKKEITIPDKKEFLDYAKTILDTEYDDYVFGLDAKYDSWVDNGWKDGNNSLIKNWKSKVKNIIPFIPKNKNLSHLVNKTNEPRLREGQLDPTNGRIFSRYTEEGLKIYK